MGTNELNAANIKTVLAGTSNRTTPKSLRTFRVVIGGKYLMMLDTTPVLVANARSAATYGDSVAAALAAEFGGTVEGVDFKW